MRAVSIAVLVALGAVAGGCAAPQRDVYVKPGATRYDAQITALDCAKAQVVAHKRVIDSSSTPNSPETRRKAFAAGRAAMNRCAAEHGFKRKK